MNYVKILLDVYRPLRWYRNLFMVIGAMLAYKLNALEWSAELTSNALWGFLSLCLIASGNYGINEVLDAKADQYHPQKKHRAIPSGKIAKTTVTFYSILLYAAGIGVLIPLGNYPLLFSVGLLLLSGIVYNIPPIRIKDYPYLDFLGEALNNPIRLMVGWYSVSTVEQIVPSSLLLAFWFLGAFLMASKRFGEIRLMNDKEQEGQYRKSLKHYTQENLLIAMMGCISAFSFMFGALCLKHGVDLVLLLPFIIVFILWFTKLAHEPNSIVKDPERVFEKKGFFAYSLFLVALFFYLVFTQDQWLGMLI